MLTDEEIKAVALKVVGESKAGQAFVSIIAKACHVVLTLDKQMAKPAPAPARKHWPRGPFTVVLNNHSARYRIECGEPMRLCYGMYKSQAKAIAVALAEFPTAVAWIREHGTMQSGEQLDRYIARRDALLARVDEAGFDLSITGEAK